MGKIPDYVIDEIREKISISEVVSQYVTLTPKGGRLWGLCPFHTEKTPSFTVQEEQGFFHCFGCGKGGSVFNFLMEIEHLNFVEAVTALAEKAGIPLEEESAQQQQSRSKKQDLYELYSRLAESFHYILLNREQGKPALEYLRKRKISDESIKKFKLGYAPSDPQWLYTFLKKQKYEDAFLKESGIFSRNHDRYPLFRHRLMFPISDQSGRVIAFGGRALDDSQNAKYLNTPETPIFHKRNNLFGLHQSLPAIKKSNTFIICEGYFDVIALHQSSVENAVAPLGTAFTEQQCGRLKRYASQAQLLFDADDAGREAAKKAAIELERMEITSSVLQLDQGKDPSEILENNQVQLLKNLPKKGIPSLVFLINEAKKHFDGTTADGKQFIFNEVRPYLEAIQSDIKLSGSLQTLSEELHIDEQVLINEMRKHTASRSRNDSTRGFSRAQRKSLSLELYLMLTVVNNRDQFPAVRRHVKINDLEDPWAREIYTALEEALREGETSFENLLLRIEQPEVAQLLTSEAGSDAYSGEVDLLVEDLLKRFHLKELEKKRKGIIIRIRKAEKQRTGLQELQELLYEKKFLDEEITKTRNG
jgi:DNA primase